MGLDFFSPSFKLSSEGYLFDSSMLLKVKYCLIVLMLEFSGVLHKSLF